MNRREFAVLEAVNIATTQFRRPGHDFEATAAQIAEILNSDRRILEEYHLSMSTREVGWLLGRMGRAWPHRRKRLVVKVDSRRWALTDAGVDVLVA